IAADLAHMRATTSFQVPGAIASGLTFAADARGDQVLAFKTCTWTASCAVRAAVRAAGKSFGRPVRLGSIDAAEAPVVGLAPAGEALLGWIDRGHVLAAALRPSGSRFAAPHVVSRTNYAANLALAFSPRG